MARGVNKVILVGNLGNDPEIRYTQNQKQVANLSIATSDSWTDRQTGQRQERTEWHRVVLFDRLAEIAGQYLRKGSKVYIEGRLQTRKWQNPQGQDQYTTEIVGNEMQMLDSRGEGAPAQAYGNAGASYGGSYQQQQQQAPISQGSYQQPASQPMQQAAQQQPMQQQASYAQPVTAPQQAMQPPPVQQAAPQQQAAPMQQPTAQSAQAPQPAQSFDDFDDSIPF